jgi:hypothetical protein
VHNLFWDPDVAGPFVLAERLRGHGPVYILHYGQWTLLWSLLATRGLPGHTALWEGLGYPFAVAGAVLAGWATSRVAGRWAGLTATAAALVVGPFALRSQLSAVYHVTTPFTAAVLAAFLVYLGRGPSRPLRLRSVAGALVVGAIAGANAASDPLLWAAGIIPFAAASTILLAATHSKPLAVKVAATVGATVASALTSLAVMSGLGFHVVGLEVRAVHLGGLAPNVRQLGRMVALLAGANYALPGGYPPEPLRLVLALCAFAALATCIWGLRLVRGGPDPARRALGWYWAASVVLLGLTFMATTNAVSLGAGSVNYLLTLPLAAGTGVALVASGSRTARLGVAAAIGLIGQPTSPASSPAMRTRHGVRSAATNTPLPGGLRRRARRMGTRVTGMPTTSPGRVACGYLRHRSRLAAPHSAGTRSRRSHPGTGPSTGDRS